MAERLRRLLVALAALVAGLGLAWAGAWLPVSGDGRSALADHILGAVVAERHATDAVSAVNFDYRGFDTLGEEFILCAAILGGLLLLRPLPDEHVAPDPTASDRGRDRLGRPGDSAIRLLAVALAGIIVATGCSICLHGQLTPGGGFQGGVVLATVPLMLYLAGDYRTFRRLTPEALLEAGEGLGTGAFVLLGLIGLWRGGAYLANVVPLGTRGQLWSGGTIAVLGVITGLAVASGFLLLLGAMLERTILRAQPQDQAPPPPPPPAPPA